jgi:predicted nucleotidyltransferase component of viral defense system
MNNERAKELVRSIKAFVKVDQRFSINEIRVIVALERAIARLEQMDKIAGHLIFKGGFVLLKIFEGNRFTRDADALAVSIPKEKLEKLVPKALLADLNDGMWYGDIQVLDIEEQSDYGAFRFDFAFQIGEPDHKKVHKLSRIHIDVGFSDRLPLKPSRISMPSLLKGDKPVTWLVYPKEFIAAEKLETLYSRGSASSRAKDVCDLNDLLPRCKNKHALMTAIDETFTNRGTPKPANWAKEARDLDKTILASAWPGVALQIDAPQDFNSAWDQLLKLLGELDKA